MSIKYKEYRELENNNLKDIFAIGEEDKGIFNQEFKEVISDIINIQDNNEREIASLINSRENNIILTSLTSCFSITFIIFFINNDIKKIFDWLSIIGVSLMAGFLGTMLIFGALNQFIKKIPFKKVKLIKNQNALIKEKFAQKLQNKNFQAEILLYLTQLESNDKINEVQLTTINHIKNNLILFFYDEKFQEGQECIFAYGKDLLRLDSDIDIVLSNEDKISNYLKQLEKETNIKINVQSNINHEENGNTQTVYDYRNKV